MKRILTALILTVAASALAFGQSADKKVEDEILKLEDELNAAIVKADFATSERLLAKEAVITYSVPALVLTKANAVAMLKSRAERAGQNPVTAEQEHGARTFSGRKVQIFGDTAIVTGEMKEPRKYGDKMYDFKVRFTDVWVKQNGKWQLAASHATPAMGVYKLE